MSVENQVVIIYALTNGLLDDVPVAQVRAWEQDFQTFLATEHPEILASIRETKDLTKENEEALAAAIRHFKEVFASAAPEQESNAAGSPILQETAEDRMMSDEQRRLAQRPEANAAGARQSH
jgi:F-type H+-transporting ATPase subunit alpha